MLVKYILKFIFILQRSDYSISKNNRLGNKIRATSLCYVCFLTFLISITSCKKFVTVDPPINQLNNSNVFATDATATSAIAGIYTNMIVPSGSFACGSTRSITGLAGLSADEFTNYSTYITFTQFYQNGILATNSDVNSFLWGNLYNDIFAANSILEGLNNSTGVANSLKQQLIGEAKFIRAFCHFYLTNLFGNVPIITTSNYSVNATVTRTPKDQVYQQIITDLKEAQNLLAGDYSYSKGERVRPNKWAATALLARVYLYEQDWANAEAQATVVINNSANYRLVTKLDSVFLKNSIEAIWQLQPQGQFFTYEGSNFILAGVPSSANSNCFSLSTQLLNAFEMGDSRYTTWINSVTINGQQYYYPYKYRSAGTSTTLTEYSMVLRLAEQYLIRSEAKAQQNNILGGQIDLNMIRNRAGLLNTTATDKSSLLLSIEHERQVELFVEWGHRWLDIKRTGRADVVFGGGYKPGWKTTAALYPIPQVQLQNDPNMAGAQNEGY